VNRGICVSGGGLRSAAFALGVLQVLQERRGMLYGPGRVDLLAAVSGGAYIAGAHVLNAHQGYADDEPPFALGSPEEQWVLSHGTYLRGRRRRMLLNVLLHMVAMAVLFAWAGMIIADFATIWDVIGVGRPALMEQFPAWACVLALPLGVSLWVRGFFGNGLLMTAGFIVVLATAPAALGWAIRTPALADARYALAVAAGLLVALIASAALGVALRGYGRFAAVVNLLPAIAVRLLGAVLLLAVAVAWARELLRATGFYEASTLETGLVLATFLGTAFVVAKFDAVPQLVSLHRQYRAGLESCFAVVRGLNDEAQLVPDPPLSAMAPTRDCPQLLISATANVRGFVPFILSHDRCEVPGDLVAGFDTVQLELGREPARLFSKATEPLLSLFTAITITGAAASPSMGRFTVPSGRAVLAALNVRLGRWIPNPYNVQARQTVAAAREPGPLSATMIGGDDLLLELFGLSGPRAYLSDGGHYDNLGLLALLRRGCDEIWCVDASPDRHGTATELERVLAIAREELGVQVTLDRSVFAVGPDGLNTATHAEGTINYGTRSGRLIVIRLGLTHESRRDLLARRTADAGFPFHPTYKQVYERDRMQAYRDAGRESASRCLDALSPPAPSPAAPVPAG